MPQGTMYQYPAEIIDFTPVAAHVAGEMVILPDGRAGMAVDAIPAGVKGAVQTKGIALLTKTADLVWVDGQEIYWDASASSAILYPASDEDYLIGVAYGDAAAAATTGYVSLNQKPTYKIDLNRGGIADIFDSVIVKTVVGSTTVEVPHIKRMGGTHAFIFGATAEAQKIDLLSKQGFAVESDWIIEGGFTIVDDGDAAAIDFNIGVANGTHATDANSITERVLLHTDANTLDILAWSTDGTTTVALTDTTTDLVLGTPVHFVIDGRNTSDIQVYINGVLQLTASVFKLNAAAGPLKLLAHLEKTADDETADYRINYLRVRTMDL
jgi:predicted RecA/RadA family phage recombinase